MKKILSALRKLASPEGPIGEWFSPADVYKTRAGLPIAVAKSQRAELAPIPVEQVERALAPERFIAAADAHDIPASRQRVVSPYVIERYSPVWATTDSRDPWEILQASQQFVGWRVTQEVRAQFCDCLRATWTKEGDQMVHLDCGRRRAPLSNAEFIEKAKTIQKAPDESYYEGYALTIPGKDTAVIDGFEVTGGTYIRSKRHHRELTKDWVFWDKGTPKEVEKALASENAKREAATARAIEEKTHRLVSDHPGDF